MYSNTRTHKRAPKEWYAGMGSCMLHLTNNSARRRRRRPISPMLNTCVLLLCAVCMAVNIHAAYGFELCLYGRSFAFIEMRYVHSVYALPLPPHIPHTAYTAYRFHSFCLIRLSRNLWFGQTSTLSHSHTFLLFLPLVAQLASLCYSICNMLTDFLFIHSFMCCFVSINFLVSPCCWTVSNSFFFACVCSIRIFHFWLSWCFVLITTFNHFFFGPMFYWSRQKK